MSDLQDLSLGYRAKYVYEAAQKVASGELDIKNWLVLVMTTCIKHFFHVMALVKRLQIVWRCLDIIV